MLISWFSKLINEVNHKSKYKVAFPYNYSIIGAEKIALLVKKELKTNLSLDW